MSDEPITRSDEPITLTLTREEAVVLHVLVCCIGGDVEHSPRRHTNAVTAKLYNEGFRLFSPECAAVRDLIAQDRAIRFRNYPGAPPTLDSLDARVTALERAK